MVSFSKKKSRSALWATLIYVVLTISAIVAVLFFYNPADPESPKDEYGWIVSDPDAKDGMLDGSYYKGEKNGVGTLSYKIAEEITVDSTGKGDFKIENSGKNTCLMKVYILVNGETLYESGYIKPNQHINETLLDKVLPFGSYVAQAVFEGFDPNTEESIGSTSAAVKLTFID